MPRLLRVEAAGNAVAVVGEGRHMLHLLVIILIIVLVVGAFGGGWGYMNRTPGTPWAQYPYSGIYYGGGLVWIVLLIVLLLLLTGQL